jgi:dUTP pyrophosphatase
MGLKDMRDAMKALKDLQSQFSGVDMQNPQSMNNQQVKLEYSYKSVNSEPEYAYPTDSGFDLRANKKVTLGPLERDLVPTGLFVNVPEGYEIQVRPKSGLSIKKGLSVVNTPGTVDQGYTGEIQVILINLSNETHTIEVGDKIAQAVLCPVVAGKYVNLQRVLNVEDKDRGANGFGSTGN